MVSTKATALTAAMMLMEATTLKEVVVLIAAPPTQSPEAPAPALTTAQHLQPPAWLQHRTPHRRLQRPVLNSSETGDTSSGADRDVCNRGDTALQRQPWLCLLLWFSLSELERRRPRTQPRWKPQKTQPRFLVAYRAFLRTRARKQTVIERCKHGHTGGAYLAVGGHTCNSVEPSRRCWRTCTSDRSRCGAETSPTAVKPDDRRRRRQR